MKHRVLFFAIMLFAMVTPLYAQVYDFTAVAPTGQTLYYKFYGNGVMLVFRDDWAGHSYDVYPTGDLVIPDNVTYAGTTYTVNSIRSAAFDGCSGLTSVVIPNTVTLK